MDLPRLGAFALCGLILHAGFAFAGWMMPLSKLIEPLPEEKKDKLLEEARLEIITVEELVELAPMPEETIGAGDLADLGARAKGDEGAMAAPAPKADMKLPTEVASVKLAELDAARDAGVLAALGTDNSISSLLGPGSAEDVVARGNLWGNEIGEAYGAGGLGLSGVGEGGGGRGEGIGGLGAVGTGRYGTIGHGSGTGSGYGIGGGRGAVRGTGDVAVGGGSASNVRLLVSVSGGNLERADAQRVVRKNLSQVRLCYETALKTNAELGGKIVLELGVSPAGSVGTTHVVVPEDKKPDATTIEDGALNACTTRAISTLTFPESDGATVTVTFILSPPPKPEPEPEPTPAPDADSDVKVGVGKTDDAAKPKEEEPKEPPPPQDPTAP